VQCPRCGADEDKVIGSRSVDDGRAIRRRRSCLGCSHRFTTFERIETADLIVVKRSGDRMPFDAERIVAGVRAASKNRPVEVADMEELAVVVEDAIRAEGLGVVSTERIGIEVLEGLRELDQVAYLRFASVYKEFADAADFAREARLLTKATTPKTHEVTAREAARSPS
jgi:transcriptional repressor NrdR